MLRTEIRLYLQNKTKAISSLQRHVSNSRVKYILSALPNLQPAQSILNNELTKRWKVQPERYEDVGWDL